MGLGTLPKIVITIAFGEFDRPSKEDVIGSLVVVIAASLVCATKMYAKAASAQLTWVTRDNEGAGS